MTSTKDLAVVCALTPEALSARRAGLLPGLARRAEHQEDTAEGLRFRFPAEAWDAIAAAVDAERRCCRFLRFTIVLEPDGGPIWLELAGPAGTREFLSALLES